MKKLITLLLAMTLTLSLTACGGGKTAETVKDDTEGKTAVDILNDTWAVYEEGEKFAIAGGDYENMVMDAPGTVNVSDGESLDALLGFPAASAGLIDDGASLMHMMNQNTFTAGVYHVTKADDVQAVADSVKENIMNRQWMCGFPDTLIVVTLSDTHVVAAFGNAEIIETFKTKLTASYEGAEVIIEESLV